MKESDTADIEKAISKRPGSKTIVVHSELYQRLRLEKGLLTLEWADRDRCPKDAPSTPTFADVIVENMHRADQFCRLLTRIIVDHPELKPGIEEVARQDPDEYKLISEITMLKNGITSCRSLAPVPRAWEKHDSNEVFG